MVAFFGVLVFQLLLEDTWNHAHGHTGTPKEGILPTLWLVSQSGFLTLYLVYISYVSARYTSPFG